MFGLLKKNSLVTKTILNTKIISIETSIKKE